jgi:hypothetical protein
MVNSTVRAAALIAGGQAAGRVVSAEVAALTKGVLTNMALLKLKSAVILACVLTVAGAAGWLTYRGLAAEVPAAPAAAAPAPAPKDDATLVALQKEKLSAAAEVFAIRLEMMKSGRDVNPETLPEWSKKWLESEKELNPGREARLKALRAHVERMKEVELITRSRFEAGVKAVGRVEMAAATYARSEAEIWLRQAEAEKK